MLSTIKACENVQYLCILVCGEALSLFDALSAEVGGATPVTLASIILVLCAYFFPGKALFRRKHVMHRRMRKSGTLKLKLCAARLVDLNEYLVVFPGAKISDKI